MAHTTYQLDMSLMKDGNGRYRTASLFIEPWTSSSYKERYKEPVYTLRNYSYKGLPSAYQIYMDSANEYEAAMRLVGSMQHWRKLLDTSWFMYGDPKKCSPMFEGLAQWRVDKQAKDEAEAIAHLKQAAEKGNVTAQKALLEYSKKSKEVGRPTKADEWAETEEDERDSKVLDLFKVINGGKSAESTESAE